MAATAASTLDDQVRAATTLASITLALLTLFTTRRWEKLAADRAKGIGSLNRKIVGVAVVDSVLALATFGALAAMSTLFWDSFDLCAWTRRSHVVESLFSLAYLGFAVIFVWQIGMVAWRLAVATRNTLAG